MGLNFIGICCNFPQDVVNGPVSPQGMRVINLYTGQGVEYMAILLNYDHQDTLTGNLHSLD